MAQARREEIVRTAARLGYHRDPVMLALSYRRWLRSSGLRVPEEVACAGLCLDQPDPDFAGAVMDHVLVGRKAVEMIALLMKRREFSPSERPTCLYVEGTWHDGGSAVART